MASKRWVFTAARKAALKKAQSIAAMKRKGSGIRRQLKGVQKEMNTLVGGYKGGEGKAKASEVYYGIDRLKGRKRSLEKQLKELEVQEYMMKR